MQILTNERRVARGARLGKALTVGSLGLLVAGLVIAFQVKESPLLWLSFACLVLGILASSVGLNFMNRWVRRPRADEALAQGLKGLDDRYRLYNYVLPAPHVLLSPAGLLVLTALGQDGEIRCEGSKFRRRFSVGRLLRFLGEEGLGKPFAQGDAEVETLRRFLQQHGVADDLEIQNVLVFYHPRAQLVVAEPPRPVVTPKGLKRTLPKPMAGRMPAAQHRQLQELFDRSI